MKTISLLMAAASLVLVAGCAADASEHSNPVPDEPTAYDKAPSPALAEVKGGSDAVISAPATALSDNTGGGGPAGGGPNPGVRPHTQQ